MRLRISGRLLPRATFFGLAALLAAAVCGLFWLWSLPLPEQIQNPIPRTTRVLDRAGNLVAEIPQPGARSQQLIPLEEMGRLLPKVTVAIEDRRFLAHRGIDFRATAASLAANVRAGRVVRGGSTITQQFVKIALGRASGSRRLLHKIEEVWHALRLESRREKKRILQDYLNCVDYGNRLIGPYAASEGYFGKPPSRLSLPEAIYLVTVAQAPTRFNPWRQPTAAQGRYRRLVTQLEKNGWLSVEEAERCRANPPTVRHSLAQQKISHFAELACAAHPPGAPEIRTTLDPMLQRNATQLARLTLAGFSKARASAVVVVIVENESGTVRALASESADPATRWVNMAAEPRSPGSTIKPFVYAQALEDRAFTAASLLPDTDDAPRAIFPDYDPRNYNETYRGPVRLREALACSLNVPAIVALGAVGPRRMFERLREWSLRPARDFNSCGAGFVLGNVEITPLDLAAAYATLARGGIAQPLAFFEGALPERRRVISAETAAIVADILSDNAARQATFGAHSPLATLARVAAKTGTSSGFRDAWTAGFTRQHTVVVWVGNASGTPMDETLAIESAAPLWRRVIDELLRNGDTAIAPIERAGLELESADICALTGLLPSKLSGHKVREWFLRGSMPKADASTMIKEHDRKLTLYLPASYAAWCSGPHNLIGAKPRIDSLAIATPLDGGVYRIDRSLPRQQQALEFIAVRPPGSPSAVWTINGTALEGGPDGRLHWPLVTGTHRLVVQSGTSFAESRFTVEM